MPLSIQDKLHLIREVAATKNVPCTKTAKELAISISILNMITYNEESILSLKVKEKAKCKKGELVWIDPCMDAVIDIIFTVDNSHI